MNWNLTLIAAGLAFYIAALNFLVTHGTMLAL